MNAVEAVSAAAVLPLLRPTCSTPPTLSKRAQADHGLSTLGVTSGTAALSGGPVGLEVEDGDEVIVPPSPSPLSA
jgi:hypothetical protein